ncbi:UPF0001 protein YlmE [Paenibacillus montaniterrae]|uniref:Pyridoxal phosphate homeostasis protein n=1 Tax=Paenibacillus montaniterrae TaxID=429341 RepID=A0A919YTS1_9BACL|nr:YggS family pyridoxal phosphate-dependent enzyme [Paenibacillus montaniterrae]GIP16713.1 UPF0001 protein YlmE [Paenibacillus montaniterrae]
MSIQDRLQAVRERVEAAAKRSGRAASEIHVVGVTKYVSTSSTVAALQAGVVELGENRWQVAKPKWDYIHEHKLELPEPIWHFIGSLQSNKVKDVVGRFDYLHSLDRLSLAEALQKQAEKMDASIKCFIQVNVSGEQSKQGLKPEEVRPFIEEIKRFDRVQPIGLMTMAPFELEAEQTRPVFAGLRQLRDQLLQEGGADCPIRELSMGMSNDFEVAIEEGATYIRLGTVLIGTEEDEQ